MHTQFSIILTRLYFWRNFMFAIFVILKFKEKLDRSATDIILFEKSLSVHFFLKVLMPVEFVNKNRNDSFVSVPITMGLE